MSVICPMLLLQIADPQQPPPGFGVFFIFTVIKLLIVFTVYMIGVALLTLAERKISAWIQHRHGPNRVGGRGGWLQPAADGLKNFMKEETNPAAASQPLFTIAPMLAFIPALTTWCVIPFASPLPTRWGIDRYGGRGSAGWVSLHPRDRVARGVRHRASRVGVQQ